MHAGAAANTRVAPAVAVRIADPAEHEALASLYGSWGYRAGIASGSVVFVAMLDDTIVGLVRRTVEEGTTMLRGMFVHPEHRRHGVGAQLLAGFVEQLPAVDCYCLPFTHLVSFYGRCGFAVVPEPNVPSFLIERVTRYRSEGHDMLVMRRVTAARAGAAARSGISEHG